MTAIEVYLSEILLRILPDPVLWGVFGLFGLAFLLKVWRSPAPVSGHLAFLFVWTLAAYLGGIFMMINALMLAGLGIALWAGTHKLIAR